MLGCASRSTAGRPAVAGHPWSRSPHSSRRQPVERLGEQLLGRAEPVALSGVEEVDAAVVAHVGSRAIAASSSVAPQSPPSCQVPNAMRETFISVRPSLVRCTCVSAPWMVMTCLLHSDAPVAASVRGSSSHGSMVVPSARAQRRPGRSPSPPISSTAAGPTVITSHSTAAVTGGEAPAQLATMRSSCSSDRHGS